MYLKHFQIMAASLLLTIYLKPVVAQPLIIRGNILCQHNGNPAHLKFVDAPIIVFPEIFPESAMWISDEGAFEIMLPSAKRLINRNTTIKFYNQNRVAGYSRIFLTSEEMTNEGEGKLFAIRQPIILHQSCESLNSDRSASQAQLDKLKSSLNKEGSIKSPILLGIGILAGLGSLLSFPSLGATPPPPPDSTVTSILPIRSIRFPETDLLDFYLLLFSSSSAFRGMHYAPAQDFETSPFLNSAFLAFSNFRNASVISDFTNYLQLSSTFVISNKIGIGTGLLFLWQNEETVAALTNNEIHEEDDLSRIYEACVSAAYEVDSHFSCGLTIKYVRQNVESPIELSRTFEFLSGKISSISNEFRTVKTRISHFDVAASFAFIPIPPLRLGMTIFNVLDNKFILRDGEFVNVRSAGFGLSFKKRRLVVGLDIFTMNRAKPVTTVGMSYILSNWFDIHASFSADSNSLQLGISLKDMIARIGYMLNHHNLSKNSHRAGLNFIY